MSREEFDIAVARLVALWPYHFADSTLAVYYEALAGISAAAFEGAVRRLVRTSDQPPSIRQILERLNLDREREHMNRPRIEHDPTRLLTQNLERKAQRSVQFESLSWMVNKRLAGEINQQELEEFTASWRP